MTAVTPGQADPLEPWRAAWLAYREAAGFDPRADLASDDEVDPTWRTSWESAARAAIQASPEAAELKRLRAALEEAFLLRQHGEYAPGGNENWHDWDRKAELLLRGES
jgi:hypothetical protein